MPKTPKCGRVACQNPQESRRLQLCREHYLESRKGKTCHWPDCEQSPSREAFCARHYIRWTQQGRKRVEYREPGDADGPAVVFGFDGTAYVERRLNPSTGYVSLLYRRPGFARKEERPEHRVVMENHLGRYLSRGEKIRHLSGAKDDNRLENLELVSPQNPVRATREERAKRYVDWLRENAPEWTVLATGDEA